MVADPALFLRPTSTARLFRARLVHVLALVAFAVALVPLTAIAWYVVTKGIGVISFDFFTQDPPGDLTAAGGGIRNAILDYYRAFEQRSEWAREHLLFLGEIEDYEDRLVDEWSRYRDVVFEELDEDTAEDVLLRAGKELYRWADQQSGNYESLRVRARVTEPYVTRGSFHILADAAPEPRVFWHPRFLDRLGQLLGASK